MEEFTEAYRFKKAKDKVNNLRAFYIHLIVYFIGNIVFSVVKINRNLYNGETFQEAFFDFGTIVLWLAWGVGILFHAFSVYGIDYILGKNWERRKLQEYLEEEERFFNKKE